LTAVTLELSPKDVLVLTWLAVTRQVPDTFEGTDNVSELTEQPVAVPFATVNVIEPVPFPPVTTRLIGVLMGAAVEVMMRGVVTADKVVPEIK
jgi:hypothetical protein